VSAQREPGQAEPAAASSDGSAAPSPGTPAAASPGRPAAASSDGSAAASSGRRPTASPGRPPAAAPDQPAPSSPARPPAAAPDQPAASTRARGTRVLDRSLAMLFELGDSDRPMPIAELAQRAGLPPSTAYRLVDELDAHGLVERDGGGGLALGLRLLELARRIEDRLAPSLLEPARGIMRALASEHDETVLLTAPAGRFAIGLDAVEPPRPVRLSLGRWRVAPMHLGASGKILLAFLAPRSAERVLAAIDGELTASGEPVTAEALRAELAEVRERGVSITHGELDRGVSGVAAPVLAPRGRRVAGLTLAGPTDRIAPEAERLSEAVREAAHAIEHALRGQTP
jgi:DNA-binding IclR family transcriptional regulator